MKTAFLLLVYLVYQAGLLLLVRPKIRSVNDQLGKGEGGVSLGGRTAILTARRSSKIAAWFIFLTALVLLLVFILDTWGRIEEFSWSSVIAAAVLVLGVTWLPWTLILIIYAKVYAVSDFGITRYSVWSSTLTLRWEEVARIGFIPFYDMFVVKSERGRIFISPLLEGIQVFAQGVVDHVPEGKWKDCRKLIERALKGSFRPDW